MKALLLQLLILLINILEHFHKDLHSELNLVQSVRLLSDVMTFVSAKEGTLVTTFNSTLDTDEISGLLMFEA